MTVNTVREAVSFYIISQLRIPQYVIDALEAVAPEKSLDYDGLFFKSICKAWFEQCGYGKHSHPNEIRALGLQVIEAVKCNFNCRNIDDVAVSMFPAFGHFLTKDESEALHRCYRL